MKKFLGIVVLGLLWFSIGYAHQPVLNDTNPISFGSPYIIEKPEISKEYFLKSLHSSIFGTVNPT